MEPGQHSEGYKKKISGPVYDWALWIEYGNIRMSMNRTSIDMAPNFDNFKSELGDEVHASSWNSLAFGGDGEVKMHFYTW